MSTATATGMAATVTRAALAEGLRFVARAAMGKATIPVLQCALIEPHADGVRLACTNLDGFAETVVPGEVVGEGGMAVDAKSLLALATGAPDGVVRLETNGTKLHVRAGGRYRLDAFSGDEWPHGLPADFSRAWRIDRALLARVLREVVFATSDDVSRPGLWNVGVDVRDARLRFTATNGHRLARITVPVPAGADTGRVLAIPAAALELAAAMPGTDAIEVAAGGDNGVIGFRSGGSMVRWRGSEDSFPDADRVIPRNPTSVAIVERERLIRALKRLSVVAPESNHRLVFDFGEGGLLIRGTRQDRGDGAEEVPLVSYEGEPIEIGLGNGYLPDMLPRLPGERVRWEMTGPMRATLLVPDVDAPDGLMVVMPMREK